jgi:alkane 1-monooxygenase
MLWFAIASLTPAALLLTANLLGGPWAWVALISVTILVMLMDRLAHVLLPVREDIAAQVFARRLGIALALTHFALLATGVRAIALSPALSIPQALALLIALGLFMGQVSNSNAHELIHVPDRRVRLLGTLVYISLLFGHHASAHPKVHHVHVATARDPNSARRGQGFYHFWPRAWIGSFRAGLRAETAARAKARRPQGLHPYWGYMGGGALALMFAYVLAGRRGVGVFLILVIYAQMQLILADYVQHYGLRRANKADGKPEPAGPQHSWNAPQWYSSAMMLNAPRHSDHHMHPMRRFPALRLDRDTMPVLPFSLPVMAAVAMIPPLWRKVMNPALTRWKRSHPFAGTGRSDMPLSEHAEKMDDSRDPDGSDGHARNVADDHDSGRF